MLASLSESATGTVSCGPPGEHLTEHLTTPWRSPRLCTAVPFVCGASNHRAVLRCGQPTLS